MSQNRPQPSLASPSLPHLYPSLQTILRFCLKSPECGSTNQTHPNTNRVTQRKTHKNTNSKKHTRKCVVTHKNPHSHRSIRLSVPYRSTFAFSLQDVAALHVWLGCVLRHKAGCRARFTLIGSNSPACLKVASQAKLLLVCICENQIMQFTDDTLMFRLCIIDCPPPPSISPILTPYNHL